MNKNKMTILVIDAQGGGVGRQLVTSIKQKMPEAYVTAAGTNSVATTAMLRAGADGGATGENAVRVGCRNADVIVGPVGIVIADSMLGEVTPQMALAVAQSRASKILIPFNHCGCTIVGVSNYNVSRMIQEAVERIGEIAGGEIQG